MDWIVRFHDEFEGEFALMDEDVQDGLLAVARAVQLLGPKADARFDSHLNDVAAAKKRGKG